MTTDLDTITAWIAVLAVASAVQTLLLVGGAIAAFIAWRRVATAIDDLERKHLTPLSARVLAAVDDVQEMTARVRQVEAAVRQRMDEWGGTARVAKDVIAARVWPMVGVARAVAAGVRALGRPSPDLTVSQRVGRAGTL